MKPKFPLYLKILLWFFLNLALLAIVAFVILAGQFGLDLLVSGPVATRIGAVTEGLGSEFRSRPRSEWNGLIESRSSSYGVKFVLFQDDGTQLAGEAISLPDEVKENLRGPRRRGPGGREDQKQFPFFHERNSKAEGYEPQGEGLSIGTPAPGAAPLQYDRSRLAALTNAPLRLPMPRPRFVLRTGDPSAYWIG